MSIEAITSEDRLLFYAQTIGRYEAMSPEMKEEFREWECAHVDGSAKVSSTDWPGFDRFGPRWGEILPDPSPKHVTKSVPVALRWLVWRRDGYACQHCGADTSLTIDHVMPQVKGGTDDIENLQTLCSSCNSRKGPR